ncbi:MAG: transglutaminase domain-containing protein [Candidatus Acidiferrum sp.]
MRARTLFFPVWWFINVFLAVALVAMVWSAVWEFSVRQYLKGFSDAIVPEVASSQEKVEAILAWMSKGPQRLSTDHPEQLSLRDPEQTLNYRQLLDVCGSATNAFLNLSRSAGLETRRLLLLTPEHTAKHVVAEVHLDGRWVIVDPTYRVLMKDARGNLLTRKDLQNPEALREATSSLPHYLPEYSYESFAHVRLAALPFRVTELRNLLNRFFPGWDEYLDWNLLLERRSFLYLFLSASSLIFLVFVRAILAWVADHYLHVPRFHLLPNLARATVSFFRLPGDGVGSR